MSLYRHRNVYLRHVRFSALACTRGRGIDVRVTTESLHCHCFTRLTQSVRTSNVYITRRESSGIRALLLGLLENSKISKLTTVTPGGKGVLHPLLYVDHRSVLSCLTRGKRSCIASSAGLRSSTLHGGVHRRIVPLLRALGPTTERGVTRSTECLERTGVVLSSTINMPTRPSSSDASRPSSSDGVVAVNGRLIVRTTDPRFVLRRLVNDCNFRNSAVSNVVRDVGDRSKNVNGV